MWPFKQRTYILLLEFSCPDAKAHHQLEEAKRVLQRELQTGQLDKSEISAKTAGLFIKSKNPKQCFGEACLYLEKILLPTIAKIRDVEGKKWVQIWTLEEASKRIAILEKRKRQ